MHSLLPHQHHDELDGIEHTDKLTQAEGIVDYLKSIFHIDLGEGHMESFDQGKGFDFDLEIINTLSIDLVKSNAFYPLLHKDSFYQRTSASIDNEIPIIKRDYLAHLHFRGPPSIL